MLTEVKIQEIVWWESEEKIDTTHLSVKNAMKDSFGHMGALYVFLIYIPQVFGSYLLVFTGIIEKVTY